MNPWIDSGPSSSTTGDTNSSTTNTTSNSKNTATSTGNITVNTTTNSPTNIITTNLGTSSIAMSTSTSISSDSHQNPIRSFDSSTSINSLFDSVPYSTNTITPILSRNDDNTLDSQLTYVNHQLGANYNPDGPEKTVVMLVGLPASGKSTIAKQLSNYINTHAPGTSRIYNAGDVRRRNAKFDNSDFFNPNNLQGKKDRELYANINIHNLIADLNEGTVQVGFLDATNTTIERRARMFNIIKANGIRANVIIMDVQCNKEHLLQFNISGKAHNLDYRDKDYLSSINDFKLRTQHYYKVYQPITMQELLNYPLSMYIKVSNGGETFENFCVDKGFQASSQFYAMLCLFESNYYKMEGKRYFEAVEAFYKNSMTNIEKLQL